MNQESLTSTISDRIRELENTLSLSEQTRYNEFIDQRSRFLDGVLKVGDIQFYPSDVLRQMDPEAYLATYNEYKIARDEEILEFASNSFPTPIAFWTHMFNRAFDNEIQRMLFLRDAWEATIRLLHALVIAETRLRNYTLRTTRNPEFNRKSLFSDNVNSLIVNIESIVKQGEEEGWRLESSTLLGAEAQLQLRTLNRLRNTFSHSQTPSELQARLMIEEALKVIIPLFADMSELSEMRLIRFKNYDPANHRNLRCEPFFGSNITPDRLVVELDEEGFSTVASTVPPYLNPTHVLVYWKREIYCLSPYFCIQDLPDRHGSQLCMFKRTRQLEDNTRVLEFEVLGEMGAIQFPREDFEGHFQDIGARFRVSAVAEGA